MNEFKLFQKQRPIYWETLNKITELHRYSFCPIPRESVFQINKGQIVHKQDKNRQKEREKGKAKDGTGDATWVISGVEKGYQELL